MALRDLWDEIDPSHTLDVSGCLCRWSVLKKITYQANHPRDFPDAPLSKLSVLKPSRDLGYDQRSPLTQFTPFLAINSVSQVSLRSCIFKDDEYTGKAFRPNFECYSANLRKLSVKSSVAGHGELSQLLSRIPNLEILKFSHETKWHGCGYLWNFGAFLDTVQNIYHKTLKELSVTFHDAPHEDLGGATLMDMSRFEKLAVLSLSIEVLCGPAYDPSKGDLESDGEESREAFGSSAQPRLIDLLPASIEKFNLHLTRFEDDDLQCLDHLIDGLSESRHTKLPRLKELTLWVQLSPENSSFEPITEYTPDILADMRDCGFTIMNAWTMERV